MITFNLTIILIYCQRRVFLDVHVNVYMRVVAFQVFGRRWLLILYCKMLGHFVRNTTYNV